MTFAPSSSATPAAAPSDPPSLSRGNAPAQLVPRLPPVKTLSDLVSLLSALERQERPDVVLPMRELRMQDDGRIRVPGESAYALTAWARRQLAESLGIRWDKWFSNVSEAEGAEEVNLRLSRNASRIRLRIAEVQDAEGSPSPVLRAFVSQGYSALSDARVAELLAEAFHAAETSVHRLSYTDMTVSYALTVGRTFRPGGDAKVGDLHGGVIVRNSGVGYASLKASAYFLRLLCLNGMTMPVDDATLVSAVHRGVKEDRIRQRLAESAKRLGGFMTAGGERLLSARRMRIENREAEFVALLQKARQPKKLLPALEAAYAKEPEETAFGISQAVTRAAQDLASENRFALEQAASGYLAEA